MFAKFRWGIVEGCEKDAGRLADLEWDTSCSFSSKRARGVAGELDLIERGLCFLLSKLIDVGHLG